MQGSIQFVMEDIGLQPHGRTLLLYCKKLFDGFKQIKQP